MGFTLCDRNLRALLYVTESLAFTVFNLMLKPKFALYNRMPVFYFV